MLSRANGDQGRPELMDAYVESVGSDWPGDDNVIGWRSADRSWPICPRRSCTPSTNRAGTICGRTCRGLRPGAERLERAADMLDTFGVAPDEVSTFVLPFPGRHFFSDRHRDLFARVMGLDVEARVPFLVAIRLLRGRGQPRPIRSHGSRGHVPPGRRHRRLCRRVQQMDVWGVLGSVGVTRMTPPNASRAEGNDE